MLSILILSFYHGIQAKTYTVQNTNDTGTNSLRALIGVANHGDTIRFNANLIGSGNNTITLASTITIKKGLTIIGLYTNSDTLFISGANKHQIFFVDFYNSVYSNQTVLFDSMVMIDGKGNTGGAIRFMFGDSLQVHHSVFAGNSASLGGAISTYQTAVVVDACNFYNNSATYGAGMYIDDYNNRSRKHKILNTSIHHNSAQKGGGVYVSSHGSSSTKNADIFLLVCNSTVSNNIASQIGGGLFIDAGYMIESTILNCDISSNTANSYAAGIYINSEKTTSLLTMDSCMLSKNISKGNGGAVYVWTNISSTNKISNSTFSSNVAKGRGGAMHLWSNRDSIYLNMANSTMNKNSSTDGGGIYAYGHYTTNASKMSFDSCVFQENTASGYGGSIACQLGSADTSVITCRNSTFNLNTAGKDGGAIWYSSDFYGLYFLNNNHFSYNYADKKGGAICLTTKSLLQFSSVNDTFQYDTSSNGGALYLYSDKNCLVQIDSGLYSNNYASRTGGALYAYAEDTISSITLNSTTISNNFGKLHGGGVYSQSYAGESRVTNVNCSYIGNGTEGGGGAIFSDADYFHGKPVSRVYARQSTFSQNKSKNGGAIYSVSAKSNKNNVAIINSTLYQNEATSFGSGIYCSNYSNIEIGSSILSNYNKPNIYHNTTIKSLGYNVFSDSMAGVDSLDIVFVDSATLNLDTLAYNGGYTKNHIPITRSIVIDRGNPTDTSHAQNGVLYGFRDIGSSENICNSRLYDTIHACDSFYWKGITFTQSQSDLRDTFTNISGCDSIIYLDLTVNYSTRTLDSIESCDTMYWNGELLKVGVHTIITDTLVSSNGCDSLTGMHITLRSHVTSADTVVAVDSFVWANVTYKQETDSLVKNLYTKHGCDSTVYCKLYIHNSYHKIDTIEACDSFTWHNEKFYASNYTRKDTFKRSNGADSIIALNLTIHPSYKTSDSIDACNRYTYKGVQYNSDTIFTDNLHSFYGCDSIVTYVITIKSVDKTTTRSNDTLFAVDGLAGYQWLDCESNYGIIPNQTTNIFVPTTNGKYAVSVENNGCTDTSDCIVVNNLSLARIANNRRVRIYPNPSSGVLFVENINASGSNVDIKIYDSFGKEVSFKTTDGKILTLTLSNYSKGLYFVVIQTENRIETHKVILNTAGLSDQ